MQTKVNIDNPIEIRNRIKKIDSLATEREYLITRLAELGFCLLEHPSAQKSVQKSSGKPRSLKIGDAVIAIVSTPHISQGGIYIIRDIFNGQIEFTDDYEMLAYEPMDYFKLHKRKNRK